MEVEIFLAEDAIKAINRLKNASTALSGAMDVGLDRLANAILPLIPNNMNWQNPTGELEGSFRVSGSGGYREVGSDLPWARRRDMGFRGADSRGRVYNDAGAYYMQAAIDQQDSMVESTFFQAISEVL